MKALALVLFSLSVHSCATIVTGRTDSVTINSSPPGARYVTNTGDEGTTPATLVVRDDVTLKVDFELEGYHPTTIEQEPRASAWVLGNLLFGLVGLVIGAAVDLGGGGGYTRNGSLTAELVPVPVP